MIYQLINTGQENIEIPELESFAAPSRAPNLPRAICR